MNRLNEILEENQLCERFYSDGYSPEATRKVVIEQAEVNRKRRDKVKMEDAKQQEEVIYKLLVKGKSISEVIKETGYSRGTAYARIKNMIVELCMKGEDDEAIVKLLGVSEKLVASVKDKIESGSSAYAGSVKLYDELKEKVLELTKRGESALVIESTLMVSTTTVRRWVREEVSRLLGRGWTDTEIQCKTGAGLSTIRKCRERDTEWESAVRVYLKEKGLSEACVDEKIIALTEEVKIEQVGVKALIESGYTNEYIASAADVSVQYVRIVREGSKEWKAAMSLRLGQLGYAKADVIEQIKQTEYGTSYSKGDLPEREIEIGIACVLKGMRLRDVAEVIGVSEETVKNWIRIEASKQRKEGCADSLIVKLFNS